MKRLFPLLLLVLSLSLATPWQASAQAAVQPLLAAAAPVDDNNGSVTAKQCRDSGGVPVGVSINNNDQKCVKADGSGSVIYTYLRYIIIFLSGLVGLGVVLMLVWGGVQYIMSGSNPTNVAAAKSRIMNALIGLVLFILMYGILNFIIPGGIL